jgi:hypothetical protein
MNSEPEENKESTGKYQIDLIDGEEDNNELSLLNDTDLDEEEKQIKMSMKKQSFHHKFGIEGDES